MPFDADVVLSIRLPTYERDFVFWTLENHDMFTVRSAYNLALDIKNERLLNTSKGSYMER
jgi:hypothetical protein